MADLTLLLKLCGDADAASLCDEFLRLCEVYDDAIDGDPVDPDAAHRAFWWALVELGGNRFYRDHYSVLRNSLATVILKWKTANQLERSGDRDRVATAYTLRCSPYDFVIAVVMEAAGPAAAEHAASALYGADTPDDRFDAYMAEHLEG